MRSGNISMQQRLAGLLLLTIAALPLHSKSVHADENGVSFWLPGINGSLAATPQQPGWSLATIYYHTSVSAGADVAFARQVSLGGITTNFAGNLSASLGANVDMGLAIPTYVFATPVLGGQAAVGLMIPFARNSTSVNATLTGAGPLGVVLSGGRNDTTTGFGDLYPQFSLRWNQGVHNWMTYVTGDIPVGSYEAGRLANIGLGHGAIDGGGGYTYFNPTKGHEFSAVGGLTYNFENPDTSYKSGIDFHLDWGASQFLTKQLQIGLVGYAYQQLTADSGLGDRLGDFKSRVFGVGPQIGYVIPMGDHQGYVNLKAYKEFGAEHRPEGWNAWLTFVVSPAGPQQSPPTRPIYHK